MTTRCLMCGREPATVEHHGLVACVACYESVIVPALLGPARAGHADRRVEVDDLHQVEVQP